MSDFQDSIIFPFFKRNAKYSSQAFNHMLFSTVLMWEVPVSVTLAQAVLPSPKPIAPIFLIPNHLDASQD